jgi:adenine/guanine/hypoxanthine permease
MNRLDRFFEISARKSCVAAELRGGVVTFIAMAYIIVLNPIIPAKLDRVAHRPVTVAYPAGSTGAPVQLASSLSAVSDGEPASAV